MDAAVADHELSESAGALGLTVAVVSDHGSWAGSAGKDAVGTPLDPHAMMPIDSITKTFTAAEVLLLAAAGDVDLDAPLSTYVRHPLVSNGITVRQVMSMRSGVTDAPSSRYDELVRLELSTSVDPWTIERTLDFLKPTLAPAGPAPVYANTNYLLLGLLVEKVTGRSMAHALRTDLFDAAHLTRIAAQDDEKPTPPMVADPLTLIPKPDGYLPLREWVHPTHNTSAGIAADAQTVAQWGYALYGQRVLPRPSSLAWSPSPRCRPCSPGSATPSAPWCSTG